MIGAYFDHNATTPLDPRVRDAMLPWMGERFGNPSSAHGFGRAAREAVEQARDRVAALLGVDGEELIFTASGTEGNNAVIDSLARAAGFRGRLVISAFEHPSVLRAAERAAAAGMEVIQIGPDGDGVVPAPDFIAALDGDTRLAALMLANNELGTLQPVAEVAAACRERGIPLLCDAVQAVGKVPVSPPELGVDYLTLGAHKFHGPLGAAALWVRSGAPFEPLLLGGSQERRRRAGTLNVAALVGLGEAARLASEELVARGEHLAMLRDRLEAGLAQIPDAVLHGRRAPRLPTTTHVSFPGLSGQDLMIRLDLRGFAVSTGSACGSGVVEAGPAMRAMGVPHQEAISALRVSFGCANTAEEVDALLAVLAEEVAALRQAGEVPA